MSTKAERAHMGQRAQWFELRFTYSPSKVECTCAVCMRKMWFPKSKAGKYLTCGLECAEIRRTMSAAIRTRNCETCAKEFTPRPGQLRNGHGRYCSQACNKKAHAAMNSSDAQKLAREEWKKTNAIAPIARFGPANHRWSGGILEKKKRDKKNGWPVQAARRAKTKNKLPDGALQEIGKSQKWKCVVCSKSIKTKFHADHITPLVLGGEHSISNIQLLCPRCNLSKSKKHPIDFMQSRGFLL